MSVAANGTANCDRCGVEIGGGILDSVLIIAVGDNGDKMTFHLCTSNTGGAERCATRILTKTALRWFYDQRPGAEEFKMAFPPEQAQKRDHESEVTESEPDVVPEPQPSPTPTPEVVPEDPAASEKETQ